MCKCISVCIMYRDGYLAKYRKSILGKWIVEIVFCVLNEGSLRFYESKGGKLMDTFELSGRKIKVEILKPEMNRLPYRFQIEAMKVRFGRGIQYGSKRVIQLCTANGYLMKDWANGIHLWKRLNWKENITFNGDTKVIDVEEQLELLNMYLNAIVLQGSKSLLSFQSTIVSCATGA